MTISVSADAVGLWQRLRLVVVDVETTSPGRGEPLRAVSLAAVTCRAGGITGRWQRLVNPGIPIDVRSQAIHHITDAHLEGEPAFAAVAEVFLNQLEGQPGETVVLAAHNAGFDVGVLRHELQLAGRDLPDLHVIDTMRHIVKAARLPLKDPRLSELLDELGVVNRQPHDALADADACAEATLKMLADIEAAGLRDLDELLTLLKAGSTRRLPKKITAAPRWPDADTVTLPDSHLDTHLEPLSARAGVRMLETWGDHVSECATLRCPELAARVEHARPAPDRLLPVLHERLKSTVDDGDSAGTATLLDAMLPLLPHLPPRRGNHGTRNAVLAWVKTWASDLIALGRCGDEDRCPPCRRGEPCPLDVWGDEAGRLALGDPERYARGFFEMTGKEAGTGAYTSWLTRGIDRRVADAALWLCVEEWRRQEMWARAQQVVELGWHAGCRHPDLADAYAGQLAASGRVTSLKKAIAVCDEAASTAAGSTHGGWGRLRSRRNQLAGRHQRLQARPSGEVDEDGNAIPARRHHPTSPRRVRPARFLSVLDEDPAT